ncbi:MAG: hypothetical protein JST78_04645 [Bacteroidetes bacterium]|nr:hypothetical protein [Bacteroidota bacterium]
MKKLLFIFSAIFFLSLTSCQEEEDVQNIDTSQSLTKDAPLSVLIRRVLQYPTNYDNVLDGTASFSVVLPVYITLNNQSIHVVDSEDLAYVKSVKNMSNTDNDIVYFTFPITLKKPDYSEIVIQSQQQYDEYLTSCGSDSNFHEISCVGFKYPIQLKLYNTSTQAAYTKKVYGNAEFYNFSSSLKSDELYSFAYPVEMQKPDGAYNSLIKNIDIESFINNYIGTCEAESNQSTISDVVVQGTWMVSLFMDEGHDETYEFNGYTFVFNQNGSLVATKNSVNTNGDWESYPHDGNTKFEIDFPGGGGNGALHYLEEDWIVLEYNTSLIKLSHQNGGGGESHLITLTKI